MSPTFSTTPQRVPPKTGTTICGHYPHYELGYCKRCYLKIPVIKEERDRYNKQQKIKDRRKTYEKIYVRRLELPEKEREREYKKNRLKDKKRRLKVLNMLGGARCVRCGCDEFYFLEINHINGGGYIEWKRQRIPIENMILKGRKTDDLEVVCRVCNALHYLKRKNPESAKNFKVIWKGTESTI